MGWVELSVVEVRCDVCDKVGVDDEDARWFTDQTAARKILTGYGWLFTGGTVRCEDCVQASACELVGHDWEGWVDQAWPWYIGRTRKCSACGRVEANPPILAGGVGG